MPPRISSRRRNLDADRADVIARAHRIFTEIVSSIPTVWLEQRSPGRYLDKIEDFITLTDVIEADPNQTIENQGLATRMRMIASELQQMTENYSEDLRLIAMLK